MSQVREEDKEDGDVSDTEKGKESSGAEDSDQEGKKNAIHANVSICYIHRSAV